MNGLPKWEERRFHVVRLLWSKFLAAFFYFTPRSRTQRAEIKQALAKVEEMKYILKQRIKVRNQTGYTSVSQKETH